MEQTFKELYEIISKLRKECPWDKKQTVESFHQFVLKETEELMDAVKNQDKENFKEEMGDVLWNLIFLSIIAEDEGHGNIKDSMDHVKEKMLRRHPHVFGDKKVNNAQEVFDQWEKIKEEEKK